MQTVSNIFIPNVCALFSINITTDHDFSVADQNLMSEAYHQLYFEQNVPVLKFNCAYILFLFSFLNISDQLFAAKNIVGLKQT